MTTISLVAVGVVALLGLLTWLDYRRICRREMRHALNAKHVGRTRL